MTYTPEVVRSSRASLCGDASAADGLSLDDRMAGELTRPSGEASAHQQHLLNALGPSDSDPQRIANLQYEVSRFQIEMSVVASLVRKAVGAVETLVKS